MSDNNSISLRRHHYNRIKKVRKVNNYWGRSRYAWTDKDLGIAVNTPQTHELTSRLKSREVIGPTSAEKIKEQELKLEIKNL